MRTTLDIDETVLAAARALARSQNMRSHARHRAAHAHLMRMARWATTPLTESAFIRLMMNPVITGAQRDVQSVIAQLAAMRRDPRWVFIPDDTSLVDPVIETTPLVGHRQVTDFHLMNLARRNNARLATFDADLRASLIRADIDAVLLLT